MSDGASSAFKNKDGVLIAMVGAAQSGKTMMASKIALHSGMTVASLDRFRAQLSPAREWWDRSVDDQAFMLLHNQVREILARESGVIVDAPNIRRSERLKLLLIAQDFNAGTLAHVVNPDLDVLLARNKKRSAVPGLSGYAQRLDEAEIIAQHQQVVECIPFLPSQGWLSMSIIR